MKLEARVLIRGKSAYHEVKVTLEGEPGYVASVAEKLENEYGDHFS